MTCVHGFIGACAECDGSGPSPEQEDALDGYDDDTLEPLGSCAECGANLYETDLGELCDSCSWAAAEHAGCATAIARERRRRTPPSWVGWLVLAGIGVCFFALGMALVWAFWLVVFAGEGL